MPSSFFLIWVVLIGAMFYFMMIKPQKKARAQQVDLMQHLAPGAEVRTNAHILGTVTEVGDEWVIIETTPGVKLKIGKPAIVAIILPDEPEETDAADVVDAASDEATVSDAVRDEADAVQDEVVDAAKAAKTDAVPTDAVTAEAAEPAENATKS